VLASLTFPVAKYGLLEMEPFTYAFFRYVISSVILFLIVRMRKHERPVERADLLKFVGLGLLIIFLNQTAYLYGQALTAAGHGALLFATVPVWIFVLAMIHLKEKLRWRRVTGLVIALAGVVIVMASGAITIGTEYLLGDLIILVAAITWAYYTVLGKPLVRKYGAFRATAYALVSGSVAYFPFGLYRAVQFDLSGVSLGGWLSVAYIAICTSVIAYVVWYWLLNRMEASRLAIYQNLQPVIAAVVAYYFLAEPLGWSFVLGGAITLAGVIISEI
jgi:drug/metabolite transporter (DMT)-like permease